jgi:hypothetical protein
VSGHDKILAILAVIVLARVALVARAWHQGRPGPGPGPAPPSRRRAAGCRSGKIPFGNKADADLVVRRSQTQRRPGYERPLERSYRCPHCGQWHTTSQRKRASW